MRLPWLLVVAGCTAAPRPMQLRKVILYQNGIGYFERTGHLAGGSLHIELARPELDDVLKTLTVIDRQGASVATVDVPTVTDRDRTVGLDVRLASGKSHDLLVGYAVPTPTWKAAYRVVLDDGKPDALLQAWAMVANTSQENWDHVSLTLATGAPMSFALDLHTPQYVKRPDATGHLVAPTVLGPVGDEHVTAGDRDGDGIPDAVDKCPDEPETYNGSQDSDGCPDRGRVVVTGTALEILDAIRFTRGSDAIATASLSILDAVAATLAHNLDITRLEIGGHAAEDEAEPWGLASRRAAAVRAALITRGIAGERLTITPYGATRPVDAGAPDKNRRVEFLISARDDDKRTPPGGLDTRTMQASARTATQPAGVAGTVRYVMSDPVSIKRGASTMVSIVNTPVRGEDVFLFRPDANAPGSDRYPFRAVRLENGSGFTLEPGPIAIFARGTFVGDGLLGRLQLGETAWIPYALEGGTQITVARSDDERPVRVVSIHRGVLTVENAGVRTTKYSIAVGRDPAAKLYIRHAKSAGFAARDLPPQALDQGDGYLIPIPITAGKPSVFTVEEREPRRRTIQLLDAKSTQVAAYVDGSGLTPELADRLRAAVALRKDMGAIEDELDGLRTRVADLAQRGAELRESLRALDKVRGADDLRKKLVAGLTQVTADGDTVSRTLGAKLEAVATLRGRLQDAIRELALDEP